MKTKVTGAIQLRRSHPVGRVRTQLSGLCVETKLEDAVGATAVRDVRHEDKPVGRIGLHAVGALGGCAPLDRLGCEATVRSDLGEPQSDQRRSKPKTGTGRYGR